MFGLGEQGYQTDWEAILSSKAEDFVSSVSAWMLPDDARVPAGNDPAGKETTGNGTAAGEASRDNAVSADTVAPLETLPEVH